MDIARLLTDLGKMADEFKKPMTLEEALDIVDPETNNTSEVIAKMPDSMAAANALAYKARKLVAEYARKKLEEEKT